MSAPLKKAEPVRVLIIRNPQPYDFGGGERMPVHLAVELSQYNFEPLLVSRSPAVLEYAASKGVQTVRGWWWSRQNWSGRNNLLLPAYFVWQLILTCWYLQLIARTRASIIHPQGRDDFIAATIAGKILSKRVIWSDHADLKYIYENYSAPYKNPIGKLVYRLSKLTSAITMTSNSDAAAIKQALKVPQLPPQYTVVYNGVSDDPVKPTKRAEADKSAYIYCATSRLVTAKGISELIDAFNKLHEKHANTRLWLIGDGPDAERFKAQAKKNPAITFFGYTKAPLALVAASDVFVHPSYLEGFSVSLIEAAMLAKPTIACNVGGNPEIITHDKTGLLIKDRDTSALYDAMNALYADRKLAQRLGTDARKNFEQNFQFETIVRERFLPLYGN